MHQMRFGDVRILGRALVLVGLVVLLLPASARALSGSVLLGFCATYSSPGGETCTHRGVDIEMSAGSVVAAPLAGEVRFAGRVPGPHGGSVIAVTLETPEGVVTMMPLSSLEVVAGNRVAEGDELGELAGSGDPSTPAAHLHLGLKRAGVYVDPEPLIRPTQGASEGEAPSAEVAPVPQTAPSPAARPAIGTPASSPSIAPPLAGGAGVASVRAGGQHVHAGDIAMERPGRAIHGEASAAGASVAPGALPAGVSIASAGHAAPSSLGMARAPRALAGRVPAMESAGLGAGMLAFGVSALSALTFLVPLFLVRRSIALRVVGPPVSDRLGTLLQHLKAGDTLCGLTSCSGPTAFTVPGPFAQRR